MSNENLSELIRRNTFYLLAQEAITPIITFFVTIYIVRTLSVDQYGVYNLLFSIMAYIGLFSSLGMLNIFKRYIPEFYETGDYYNLKRLVRGGVLLRGILILIFCAGIALFSGFFAKLFHIQGYVPEYLIFSLGILFYLESQLVGLTLTSIFLHKYFSLAQGIYAIVRTIMVLIFLHMGLALRGLIIAEVIGFILLFFLQLHWYKMHFEREGSPTPQAIFPWKRLQRFGLLAYFNEMGEEILEVSTDFFIISACLGQTMNGLYAFAVKTMVLISRWMPHRMLLDLITPIFYTRYTQTREDKDLEMMFNLLNKLIAFFFFPLVAGILVLGDKMIIFLFTPKYLQALDVLWIVAIFSLLNGFATPLGLLVQSVEKVEINLYSKIFAVYNLVGDLLVVNRYGIIGVALVTGSAVFLKNIFIYIMIKKYVRFRLDYISLIRIFINSVLLGFALYHLRFLATNLAGFLLVVLAGTIIYAGIAFIHHVFNDEERSVINRIVKKPVMKF